MLLKASSMKISIAARNRPFSHLPGASALLPERAGLFRHFQPKFVYSIAKKKYQTIYGNSLKLHGPVREFTLQQDLEKGIVLIWGIAVEGRFRLRLQAGSGRLNCGWKKPRRPELFAREKCSKNDHLSWNIPGPFVKTRFGKIIIGKPSRPGVGKCVAQDRFTEIFPVLFHLSQWTPNILQGHHRRCSCWIEDSNPFCGRLFWDFVPAAHR